jgi:hypothetical protein
MYDNGDNVIRDFVSSPTKKIHHTPCWQDDRPSTAYLLWPVGVQLHICALQCVVGHVRAGLRRRSFQSKSRFAKKFHWQLHNAKCELALTRPMKDDIHTLAP